MRELRNTVGIVDDPQIAEYVQRLGNKLIASSDTADYPFRFFVVESPTINAFAAPGGYVGFNTGLILAADSESELASVFAHEIAHVTQQHIARQIEISARSTPLAIAGFLAALLIGTQNANAGAAAAAAVQGAQAQNQLDFSRAFEREADRVGIRLLRRAGYDPQGMAEFFNKLQTASRYYTRPPEFLSTHPVTTSRIAEARSFASESGYKQHASSLDFYLTRAKIRVNQSRNPSQALQHFDAEIRKAHGAARAGASYGRALTLARIGRAGEARQELATLAGQFRKSLAIQVALAQAELAADQRKPAMRRLQSHFAANPNSAMLAHALAESQLQNQSARAALRVVEEHQRIAGTSAESEKLRARALAALGQQAESRIALAEHFYLQGLLGEAIGQLKLAAQVADLSFYQSSRIEARLADIEREHRERAKRE